ncbi:MAG: NAD(P)H-dependent oxidoreductase [Candidatus Altiarchaeia archaeon]
MKVLVVLGHPRKGSFNHAIADRCVSALKESGHIVFFHDLYEERFDPLITWDEIGSIDKANALTRKHCKELEEAEGIIIIHPNWWGQPPAILKGWIDKVFRAKVAYQFDAGDKGEGIPRGLLKARKAIVYNTSDTPPAREKKQFGDPLETTWKNCIFDFCGVKQFRRRTFSVIVTSTLEQRKAWLDEVSKDIGKEFPEGAI